MFSIQFSYTAKSESETASVDEKKDKAKDLIEPATSSSSTMKKKQPTTKRPLRSAVISTVLSTNEQTSLSHQYNDFTRKRRKSFNNDSHNKRKIIKVDEKIARESHSDSEKHDDVKENKVNTTKFYVTLNGVKDIYKGIFSY